VLVPDTPFKFNAKVVLVGVVNPVVIANVPDLPDQFNVFRAFEEIVEEAPLLASVTVVIVPAAVAEPAFTSLITTAPLAMALFAAVAATAAVVTAPVLLPDVDLTSAVALAAETAVTGADWLTETLVVIAVPVTVTAPLVAVDVLAAADDVVVSVTDTVVPPVIAIEGPWLVVTKAPVELTVTAPVGAVVAPTEMEPDAKTPVAVIVVSVALLVVTDPAPKEAAVMLTEPEAVPEVMAAAPVLLMT